MPRCGGGGRRGCRRCFLSTREAADLLGVSENTVRNWVDAGKIPSCYIGMGNLLHRRIPYRAIYTLLGENRGDLAPPQELDPEGIYTMGFACNYLGVSGRYLRELEAQGIIQIRRDSAGRRIFTGKELEELVNLIHRPTRPSPE